MAGEIKAPFVSPGQMEAELPHGSYDGPKAKRSMMMKLLNETKHELVLKLDESSQHITPGQQSLELRGLARFEIQDEKILRAYPRRHAPEDGEDLWP